MPISVRRSAASMTKIKKMSMMAAKIEKMPNRVKTEVKMPPAALATVITSDLLNWSIRSNWLSWLKAARNSVSSFAGSDSRLSSHVRKL